MVYTSKPNGFIEAFETLRHFNDQWYTYGLEIGKDDTVTDVREGSPAWAAGLAPGMKIAAVDGQAYSDEALKYVSTQAEHSSGPTEFLVQQDSWYHAYQVTYHGGPQYPHLVRIAGKPDMLAKIMAPHAGS